MIESEEFLTTFSQLGIGKLDGKIAMMPRWRIERKFNE